MLCCARAADVEMSQQQQVGDRRMLICIESDDDPHLEPCAFDKHFHHEIKGRLWDLSSSVHRSRERSLLAPRYRPTSRLSLKEKTTKTNQSCIYEHVLFDDIQSNWLRGRTTINSHPPPCRNDRRAGAKKQLSNKSLTSLTQLGTPVTIETK